MYAVFLYLATWHQVFFFGGGGELGIRLAYIHTHASMHCTQSHITHDVMPVMDIFLLQHGAMQYGYSQVCVFMAQWDPMQEQSSLEGCSFQGD